MVQAGPTHCRRHPAVEKSSSCDLDGHSPPLLARKAPAPLLCCPLARVAVTPPYCRACTPVRRPTRAVARLQWALRLALPALQSCSIAPPPSSSHPTMEERRLEKAPLLPAEGVGAAKSSPAAINITATSAATAQPAAAAPAPDQQLPAAPGCPWGVTACLLLADMLGIGSLSLPSAFAR